MLATAEKVSGIPADFSTSLELTTDRVGTDRVGTDRVGTDRVGTDRVGTDAFVRPASEASTPRMGRTPLTGSNPAQAQQSKPDSAVPNPDSGASKNLHCPHPLPSGF
jgi:hypothetical protein